jgi:hypothetical protein
LNQGVGRDQVKLHLVVVVAAAVAVEAEFSAGSHADAKYDRRVVPNLSTSPAYGFRRLMHSRAPGGTIEEWFQVAIECSRVLISRLSLLTRFPKRKVLPERPILIAG